MARPAVIPVGAQADWLSLGPASRLVGVDPDTLRRWADGGRVRAFATPGGHRRFDRADLARVVAGRRREPSSLASLGATEDRLTRAYARAYRDQAPVAPDRLHPDAREALRGEGRRLVAVLLAYLDAARPAERVRWEGEALELIGTAGRRLADAGADAHEVVSIYLRARQPLLGALGALGKRRALGPTQLAAVFQGALGILDRLLLHLIESHAVALAAVPPRKEIPCPTG
jgi:excisionase family DNA binding protein